MLRQIILDTETTGLEPKEGHRVIEIGCLEMINRRLTKNHFHYYINPGRDVEMAAQAVHGITEEFLADKPLFADIIDRFIAYIKGAELIIHNAPFDVGFLNHEFKLLGANYKDITHYCKVFDTLAFARKKHPGQRNSLDALCKRYKVDNSKRDLHGALLDAQLLADVYLVMTGGQGSLFGDEVEVKQIEHAVSLEEGVQKQGKKCRVIKATEEELHAHEDLLKTIKKASDGVCIWENLENL